MMPMTKQIYRVIHLYEGKIKAWYMRHKYKALMNSFMTGIKREYALPHVMTTTFGNSVDWIIAN